MELAINAGNSRVKYGVFQEGDLMKVIVREHLTSMDIDEICTENKIT